MEDEQTMTCQKCGGSMEAGVAWAVGTHAGPMGSGSHPGQVDFVIGTPTSLNPVKAFRQGASDEPMARRYRLTGARCSRCGIVELYAAGDPTE
jgi:hypothetical protein